MSIYRKTIIRLWPQNTLRAAYLQWQAQETRLVEVRQRLARQYLAARRQAEQVQTKAHQGLLRAARSMLDQPLDPMILAVKGRLQKEFTLRGKGLFSGVPSPLQVELAHYAADIEKICQSHNKLGARLRLAQALIGIFDQTSEYRHAHFFRLAIISPESAWLLFHLRQKRLKDHQAVQDRLAKTCQFQTG
jgi:hypothetical protein